MFKTLATLIKIAVYLIKSKKQLKIAQKYDKTNEIKKRDEIVGPKVIAWAKYCIDITGSEIEVVGLENVPKDKTVVYIGNHQGAMDIPLLLGYIPFPKAFIAKIEILKIPILSKWMKMMQCVFLNRKDMRQSVKAMHDAVDIVKNGYSLVIFPEGTRSKGGPVKSFKPGSFKLAFQSESPIVPVTIDGSWRIYEEYKGIHPGKIKLTIHKPIETKGLSKEELQKIPQNVQSIIESALTPESFVK